MKDDIETLRKFITGVCTDKGRKDKRAEAIAALNRFVGDYAALRKALDDRYAADKKAWSAIMRATGKERGLPDNKEVIAFYVADNERLEKERDDWKSLAQQYQRERAELADKLNGTPCAEIRWRH